MSETIEDLGRKAKRKHPRYRHLSDAEAGRQLQRDYPGAYTRYQEAPRTNSLTAAPRRDLTVPNYQLDETTQSHIEDLRGNLKPNNGWFYAWRQTIKSERNIRLLEVLTRNEIAIIEHGAVLEKAARNKEREVRVFEEYLQQHQLILMGIQAKAMMLKNSVDLKIPIEYYGEYKKEELLTDLRIKEYLATEGKVKENTIKYEQELSAIKVKEYEEKARIDLENEVKKAQEKLRFAITANHLEDQKKIEYIQDLINQKHIEIANTRKDPNIPTEAKESIIQSTKRIIKMYEEQQDEAQKRILQPQA